MHIVQRPVRRSRRRMYSPIERGVVSNYGVGLGEVDGLFNIGKMFTRMFTFRPKSFTFKNIAGALGSVTSTALTGGLISLAPKLQSAHSSLSRAVGYGTMAVAAVAGGAALLPAGSLMSVGSAVGTGLKTLTSVLPIAQQVMGGRSGGQQGVDPYAQQYAQQQAYAQQQMAQQAYEAEQMRLAQIAQQQAQMYLPGAMAQAQYEQRNPSMQTSYGDLRSPYTAITEDGQQVQVDPATGQVIQAGILPELSMTTWLVVGGVTLVGWYFMSGSKRVN